MWIVVDFKEKKIYHFNTVKEITNHIPILTKNIIYYSRKGRKKSSRYFIHKLT